MLRDQLALLDGQMDEIADAVNRQDSDRLLTQGRFLEERFGRRPDDLKLPPQQPWTRRRHAAFGITLYAQDRPIRSAVVR